MPDCQGGRSRLGITTGAHSALAALKRFGPLVCVAAAMLLVLVMGWHREVTLENIVALRERFQHVPRPTPILRD